MSKNPTTRPKLGSGIYTISDAARILQLPAHKVRRWLTEYWNKRFGDEKTSYSWGAGGDKAFSFLALMEFYVFYQLKNAGLSTIKILEAHGRLASLLRTHFPFASATLLTDGGSILLKLGDGSLIDVKPGFQFYLKEIIEPFCQKIEFGADNLAQRFYPLGKEKGIVVDPRHQFGQPTIVGTNLLPYTIWNHHLAGEKSTFIARIFEISEPQVKTAIEYCKATA